MLAEALGVERIPGAEAGAGRARARSQRAYDRETACDWTSGSFMIARHEALESLEGGGFDERFFLFSEETDLCWRLKQAGWQVVHMPGLTIRHYEHDGGLSARMEAQAAYARLQFARKHFRRVAAATAGRSFCATGCASAPTRRWASAGGAGVKPRERRSRRCTAVSRLSPARTRAEPQATIVRAPGSARSSTRVRSPM